MIHFKLVLLAVVSVVNHCENVFHSQHCFGVFDTLYTAATRALRMMEKIGWDIGQCSCACGDLTCNPM